MRKAEYESAIEAFERALAADSSLEDARAGIARARLSMGDFDAASEELQAAAGEPQHATKEDLYNLGELEFAKGAVDIAAGWYDEGRDDRSRTGRSPLFKLALVALNKGDIPGAKEYFQRVVDVGPNSPEGAQAQATLNALAVTGRHVTLCGGQPGMPAAAALSGPRSMHQIRSVAVLGAGRMGAQIAAHAANAGLAVLLLDLDAKTAKAGLERARRLSPDPFFTPDAAARIAVGGFDSDLSRIAGCDWIVEAIVEELDVKRQLLARVDDVRGAGAIVSSNTSGLPIASLAEGRSAGFRRHCLGTHFFNPPRYLPLLEVIPTADTDPAVVDAIRRFADRRLGKGVVIASDSPGFIANRIATSACSASSTCCRPAATRWRRSTR